MSGIDVRNLHAQGRPRGYLVTLRLQTNDIDDRIGQARARWQLTRRQVEVLRSLVRGDANKDLAATLGTSLSTIEIHVTDILRKAKCESRARLLAAFYTQL